MTYSRRHTHVSGHPSATSPAQDKESSPAKDRRYTVVPHDQLLTTCTMDATESHQRNVVFSALSDGSQ